MVSIARRDRGFSAQNRNRKVQKWWIEINTDIPRCTYYFGPFDRFEEAVEHQEGYVEDLIAEGSREITVNIKKCHPLALTIEIF